MKAGYSYEVLFTACRHNLLQIGPPQWGARSKTKPEWRNLIACRRCTIVVKAPNALRGRGMRDKKIMDGQIEKLCILVFFLSINAI